MGSGTWSSRAFSSYSDDNDLTSKGINDTFQSTAVDSNLHINTPRKYASSAADVSPQMLKVGVRECIENEEHPITTPIIIAFDVTGSMGEIPHMMIQKYLPKLMDTLKEMTIPNPQLLFMAIGDHYTDDYPVQVGQFESDTIKIAESLRSIYIEQGGGGNNGESYSLAHIVAGYHTELDCYHKRKAKGFLFTIGDEPNHPVIESRGLIRSLQYESGVEDLSQEEALRKAKEQYHVFHIHVKDGYHRYSAMWESLLGTDHVLKCLSEDICTEISKTIYKYTPHEEDADVETSSPADEYLTSEGKHPFY